MNKLIVSLLALIVVVAAGIYLYMSGAQLNLTDIWRNNQAVSMMQQKKMFESHENFTRLLAEEPFHPVYRFNMASTFIAIEEVKKAIKMYEEVLKLQPLPPEILFATHFNLGFLHSLEGGDIKKALVNYQKALDMSPESVEVKTNIELLFKGGQGKGKGKNKDKKKDDKKEGEGEQEEPKEFTNDPQDSDPSKGKQQMSKEDVKKILEELKKQEQKIRAKHERKGGKEPARGKNW